MKVGIIGVGHAGGKLLDAFLEYDVETPGEFVRSALALNTATADLQGLRTVPRENRVLYGERRSRGDGVGADNDLGIELMAEDIDEVRAAVHDAASTDLDAFLLVAGLGGGTGSGGAPVLANHLKRVYEEPVYALGILPADVEGGLYSMNAARALQTLVREADNVLLFDNDAWRTAGESLADGYERMNDELVRRFGVLFSAGEVPEGGVVGESVVDASEVANTLTGGGISTVGYAVADIDRAGGLLSRFRRSRDDVGGSADRTSRITSLVRQATEGRLTLPCEVASAERVLVVVAGPPGELSRKGVERARSWLEERTGCLEVRGGDYPLPDEDQVAAAVLLSGVTDVPPIDRLKRLGVETKESIEEREARSEADLDALLDDEELRPLF